MNQVISRTPRILAGMLRLGATLALPLLIEASGAAPADEIAARESGQAVFRLLPGSRLWIEGNSTLHPWSSSATRFEVALAPSAAPESAGTADLERSIRAGGIGAVEVSIPVAALRSEKSGLDRNLQKALMAEKYPLIRFRLGRYTASATAGADSIGIHASGRLTIASVERAIELEMVARSERGHVRIRGSRELLMTDYGIKPPTLMLGAIRVANPVVVRFDLLFGDSATVVTNSNRTN